MGLQKYKMNFELTRQLLLYIVGQLQDQEGMISKIRIVKLLYLVDVEFYRMFGHTLTNLNWIFYEYGPYAFEIDTIIEKLSFDLGEEEITTSMGHTANIYHIEGEQVLDNIVNFATKAMIDRIINRWALEDTHFILDYVYTGTEPMQSATFNQRLDFSKIRRDIDVNRPMKHLQLAKNKSAKIQDMLKNRRQSQFLISRYDEVYFEAMNVMNQEDKFEEGIEGSVKISPESTEAISQQIE